MSTIESKVIGTLKQQEEFENFWKSAPTMINLIDKELTVSFIDCDPENDPDFLEEADQALSNFLNLDSLYKLKTAPYIFENFVEYCSYINAEQIPGSMNRTQPLSVWNFVYPTQVFVNRRPKNDKDIYVILACECEWNQEHGLQLVFRQGKQLTRVSDQDGHLTEADAYNLPDNEDKLLAAFS